MKLEIIVLSVLCLFQAVRVNQTSKNDRHSKVKRNKKRWFGEDLVSSLMGTCKSDDVKCKEKEKAVEAKKVHLIIKDRVQ
jgi:hypothetical protein